MEARGILLLTMELPGVRHGQARCVILTIGWPVGATQMLGQGLPACVAELYGLFFSCSARTTVETDRASDRP